MTRRTLPSTAHSLAALAVSMTLVAAWPAGAEPAPARATSAYLDFPTLGVRSRSLATASEDVGGAGLLFAEVPAVLRAWTLHAALGRSATRDRAGWAGLSDVVLLPGHPAEVRASFVRAAVVATRSGAAGVALVEGLTFGGSRVAVSGTPNQRVELPGATLIIDERLADANGSRPGLTVNALHLILDTGEQAVLASARGAAGDGGAGVRADSGATSGSGWFAPTPAGSGRAWFAFDAAREPDGSLRGHLSYVDGSTGMSVQAERLTALRTTSPSSRSLRARVEVDGEPGYEAQVQVFDDPVGGADRFRIELSDGYSADSGGSGDPADRAGIDRGDVWVSPASASAQADLLIGPLGERIEEDDPRIDYVAADLWYDRFSPGFSGGVVEASPHAGQTATLTFTGSGVDWIGYRASNTGIARVYLDGTLVAEVDTFSPVPVFQVPLYSARELGSGTHRLAIEVTGTYSTPLGSAWIAVDAFDVTP